MKFRINLIALLMTGLLANSCDTDTDFIITIGTPYGDMTAVLYDDTPLHKENFLKLARQGGYDSTIFHRIISEFMIQGGDINQKGDPSAISYTIPAEFVPRYHHRRGALAAARQPDQFNPERASSGSQFYVVQGKVWDEEELTTDMQKLTNAVATLIRIPEYDSLGKEMLAAYEAGDFDRYNQMLMSCRPIVEERLGQDVSRSIKPERLQEYLTIGGAPWLDDQYTVFGQVIKGLDVIDKIAAVETGTNDKPVENIYMTVSVEELPKKKITELYGIQYGTE